MNRNDQAYAFVLKGELAQVAADLAIPDETEKADYIKSTILKAMPRDLRDTEFYAGADKMALIYASIATFENIARKFIQDRLLEDVGEEWWSKSISGDIRKRAENRQKEESSHRYHGSRGGSLIYYTDMSDLPKIIHGKFDDSFSDYLPSYEWARQIFKSIERSRNVIMHSGVLAMDDIQRVGMNIRDWMQQVGD